MRVGNSFYFDHQATTPIDARALEEMSRSFEDSFGNPHSVDHSYGWRAAQAVETAADRIARLIGADGDEIIFTSGATEANNLALLGLARKSPTGGRRRILLGATEHKCILDIGRVLEEHLEFKVELLPVDQEGRIQIEFLKNSIADDVLFVSVMAVNNEIGTISDLKQISEITSDVGTIFHCDAAQAPCSMDLTSIVDNVDLLSLSAHKMYGPQGMGACYIRRDLHDRVEPIMYGGGQQNGLRSGTVPVHLCVGMGAAAEILDPEPAAVEREGLRRLRDRFVEGLMSLPFQINLNGPRLDRGRHPGNANLCFQGFAAHDILGALQPRLAASTGSACSTGIPEPSHVLKAIGLSDTDIGSSIRFSFGRQTTDTDITEAIKMIEDVLVKLNKEGLVNTA